MLVCQIFLFFILQIIPNICAAEQNPHHTLVFVGQDLNSIQNYLKKVDKNPDGFMVYTSVSDIRGLFEPVDQGAGVQNAQFLLKKHPRAKFQIGLYMVDNLKAVTGGTWDKNLETLARWIKQTKEDVYLRIGYEFDLPDNHYDPDQYIKAFQYIVSFLRQEKVNNVYFVWHSFGYVNPGKPPINWYPGDEFVDYFGISFFKAFNSSNYKSFLKLAQTHNKPFMIAEATPFGVGTRDGKKSWNMWFKPFFEYVENSDIPIISYINADWESQSMFRGQGWGDCRIEENSFVNKNWREKIDSERFQNK